ncbi:DUF1045 domain-containing protein [Phreatobacter sp.]|uniref:DUF1045 domain-containing protein n=1 Tax=Phreatobacter sp. TaxID=1966341 RepID=UPI003F70D519
MTSRYALFVAPPSGDPLWTFGSSVIGYDAALARDVPWPEGEPFDAPDWPALTAAPRPYGLHGTIKAPFELAAGLTEADLLDALSGFARSRPAFVVPRLAVSAMKSFVALLPAAPCEPLDRLATETVRHFNRFRAPLSSEDMARRLAAPLTARQKAQLDAFGYPYIFDDFVFHMTLTGPLAVQRQEPIRAALAAHYAPVDAPFVVDALVVYRQARREDRFSVLTRVPLEG